jgi:integrase/recombinase XerD
MTLAIYPTVAPAQNERIGSLNEALALRDQVIWGKMEAMTLSQIKDVWLDTLSNPRTQKNYKSAFEKLFEHGIINPFLTLQQFALVSHRSIISAIKHIPGLSECTKQARAAAYISFTRYLSDILEGNFKRAIPSKEGTTATGKTFHKVHEIVKTEAMTPAQWNAFLVELHKVNSRDCLIAKLALQGAKRINEVLSLTVEQINFEKGEINFTQLKTRGTTKQTTITFPASIMNELKDCIGERKGKDLVFITRNGKALLAAQVQNTFARAGVAANIPFKVHPHVLRASAITEYKRLGYSDSDIAKISGHADLEMLNSYDKSNRGDNASKRASLVI